MLTAGSAGVTRGGEPRQSSNLPAAPLHCRPRFNSVTGATRAMAYEAKKTDKFTFGLWTLGNPGRDPFGEPVRKGFTPVEMVRELSKLGAFGVNFHDNDLVPFGSSPRERDRIVREFQGALKEAGMVVPMATTNLFGHPVLKDGAFTSNNADVRAFA